MYEFLYQTSHRRLNPLTGEWVLVSPHRLKRPWKGKIEKLPPQELPEYDPNCYLCPGNVRAGGIKNPDYKSVFVFDNDFSALITPKEPVKNNTAKNKLLIAHQETGICRVICFSPYHNLTLPELDTTYIIKVVKEWINQYRQLGSQDNINYVTIFENKGEIMGCSNPHPHGQIWGQKSIPVEPAKELLNQQKYLHENKQCLLCNYVEIELKDKERIVLENNSFLVVVPFWAIWPYETLILPKRHISNIAEFSEEEIPDFADIIKRLTIKYDNLFETSFPYSAGMHNSPTDNSEHPEWHFHMHFYPPLLRSATIKKFMVGYEMLGEPQRDLTPEASAEKLRVLSPIHYKQKGKN